MRLVDHPTHTNQVYAGIGVCSSETDVHTPVGVSHRHMGTAEPGTELEHGDEKNQGTHGVSFRNSRNCCVDKDAVTTVISTSQVPSADLLSLTWLLELPPKQ